MSYSIEQSPAMTIPSHWISYFIGKSGSRASNIRHKYKVSYNIESDNCAGYIYINGHGDKDGALSELMSYAQRLDEMDKIGHKDYETDIIKQNVKTFTNIDDLFPPLPSSKPQKTTEQTETTSTNKLFEDFIKSVIDTPTTLVIHNMPKKRKSGKSFNLADLYTTLSKLDRGKITSIRMVDTTDVTQCCYVSFETYAGAEEMKDFLHEQIIEDKTVRVEWLIEP